MTEPTTTETPPTLPGSTLEETTDAVAWYLARGLAVPEGGPFMVDPKRLLAQLPRDAVLAFRAG